MSLYNYRVVLIIPQERGLLFANDDDNQSSFDLPSTMYLDLVCPMDMPTTTTGPITMPTGVLSLSQLKTLPLEQQVCHMTALLHDYIVT